MIVLLVSLSDARAKVSLLNQEVIIEKLQSVVELKLRSSNESRIFQEQSKDIWMAKHLCIHKGHGRDVFGEVKRYLPSSKAKDNTKSFRVKLRLKSLVDWEKIQREADRVNEGKVKKDDAKLQTCMSSFYL
nr:MutL-like protein 1 [Ipomoea batatas]